MPIGKSYLLLNDHMLKFLSLLTCLFVATIACAQTVPDEIQYSGGKIFYQNRRVVKAREIGSILLTKPSPEMSQFVKKYKTNNGFATAFGFVGGFGVGYTLGTLIGGGKTNYAVLGTGIGGLLVAAIFDGSARSNLKQAVATYNEPWKSPEPQPLVPSLER